MKTFANRLRYARESRGQTQAELAAACGVAQSTVANYENGLRRSPRHLLQLAAALNVSPHWLADGVGAMEQHKLALEALNYQLAGGDQAAKKLRWPFSNISPEIFWSLSPTQRELVEDTVAGLIASLRKEK